MHMRVLTVDRDWIRLRRVSKLVVTGVAYQGDFGLEGIATKKVQKEIDGGFSMQPIDYELRGVV